MTTETNNYTLDELEIKINKALHGKTYSNEEAWKNFSYSKTERK